MKHLFLLLACVGSFTAYAQSANQHVDATRVNGHFDIVKTTQKGNEHINVNYNLSPAPFTTVLDVTLNTPNPVFMSVKITNGAGRTVLTWKPEMKSYNYNTQFNIATLPAGSYHMDVYDDAGHKLHSVLFSKNAAN